MKVKITLLIVTFGMIAGILGLHSNTIEQSVKDIPLIHQFVQSTASPDHPIDSPPLEHIYVTVLSNDPDYGYNFQEIQFQPQVISKQEDPLLPVYMQTSPQLGDESGEGIPNATIEIRGNSARRAELQSFKIRLNDGTELWGNQDVINLNKHPYDKTHVRNKLSYDLIELIPDLPSLDTRFVRLYIKDLTASTPSDEFIDYGLFTHVEQVNKAYMERQFLDSDGYLYKAINFEFYRYPDILRDRNDPLYDKEKFETVLEIGGREYHEKLLTLLDALNNESLDITSVVDQYFDKDNLLTWLAVNLIMGNLDTSSNNFYLYSPLLSDKWFFIPWDYDGAWNYHYTWGKNPDTIHPFREGLSLYSGWPWVRRYFAEPENLQALTEKIESLSQIITEEQTKKLLDEYYPTVRPLMLQQPNVRLLLEETEKYDAEYYALVDVPRQKLDIYKNNLEKPLPVFIGSYQQNGSVTLSWNASVDLQGDVVYYDLVISRDPELSVIYYEQEGLRDTQLTLENIPAGNYYWTVIIRDSKGYEQVPFENSIVDGTYYHGVKMFTVTDDSGEAPTDLSR